MTQELQEFRCAECRKLLFKAASLQAMIEIKCKGCKQINVIDAMQGMESSRIYLSETVQA